MANAVDPLELLDSFVEEVEGYLPTILANLRRLLLQPGTEELLEESHRFAHTIKSSAAMMGLPELRKLAIPMEALLAQAYAGDVGITANVVTTVEGTLDRIQRLLTGQRQGGVDVAALVRENDASYATLKTAPPAHAPVVASEDATDRLAHLDATSMGDLSLILAPGQRIDDSLPLHILPEESVAIQPPPAERPVEPVPEATSEPAPPEVREAAIDEPEPDTVEEARPRLTILQGGQTSLPEPLVGDAVDQPTIAAEWLAEILDNMAARVASPPLVADEPPSTVAEPLSEPVLEAEAPDEPTPVAAAPLLAPALSEHLTIEWETRLATERARFEQVLKEEREQNAAQQRRLREENLRALAAAAEAHERALEEQRSGLEAHVQRYIEEELKPELEEELREELAREFEIAALVDAGPDYTQARSKAATPRRVATPDDALRAEMREIFAQEADEHLQAIGEHALALRHRPEDVQHLAALRRSVHTLKGAGATVGEAVISNLCHQMESVLDAALDHDAALEESTFVLLMEGCEALEGLIHQRAGADAIVADLIGRLSPLTGITTVAAPAPRMTVESLPEQDVVEGAVALSADEPAGVDTEDGALTVQDAGATAADKEETAESADAVAPPAAGVPGVLPALRMGIGQFDRVLGANHELIIAHAALEQRLQLLTQFISDLGQSGDRLRGAALRLEASRELALLLASAPYHLGQPPVPDMRTPDGRATPYPVWATPAMSATSTSESVGGAEFDALELDRYTEFHRLAGDVSEATLDVTILRSEMENLVDDLRQVVLHQERLHKEQNDVLLDVRTFPLQHVVPRVAQALYAVASRLGKPCEFVVEGEHTLLDRAAMEPVADAILHLVRNAVDHGIETAEEREAHGKPARGTVRLAARREGPEVVLTLSDDGGGLDVERIREVAITRGVIAADAILSDAEVQQLIFAPGMSTAGTISDLSGRGVGLDVVRTNVAALRGQVHASSTPGEGTTFTLRLPSSLSLLAAALVGTGGHTYAIPLALVRHVAHIPRRRIRQTEEGDTVNHGGRSHPAVELSRLLGVPSSAEQELHRSVLFLQGPSGTVALLVDQMVGTRSVVIKDIGKHLRAVRGVFGATVLGTGELVLILDLPALLDQDMVPVLAAAPAPKAVRSQRVLVVDDSASVRHLVSSLFQRRGWDTQPARDGQEALATVGTWRPDVVVTDVEMPRMDGYELLAILKRQTETADIPVVMVTSRSGEKHREKARQLGVDAYLVKPYQEEELLGTVETLALGESTLRAAAG